MKLVGLFLDHPVHLYTHHMCCIATGSCRPFHRSTQMQYKYEWSGVGEWQDDDDDDDVGGELLVSVVLYQLQVS